MITITNSFWDAETMEDFIIEYFNDYPIGGYGTMIESVKVTPVYEFEELDHLNYEVTLSRFESCD